MAEGTEIGTGYISIVPSMRGFGTALGPEMDRAGKEGSGKFSKGFGSGIAAVGGKLFAPIAAAAAAVGTISFLGDSIEEAREAEKVGKTTAQIIKSTGGAAKISAPQVAELAGAISAKTGMDDEAIQSGANLLLTFKNVKNEAGDGAKIFDRATTAAADLSAAGFGSVDSASKMLGKALNDPIKGISALGRAGVTFTEQQKAQIKAMADSGDMLGAQKIIMAEVESQVGGVAAASATAGEKFDVAFGNFKESVGTALLPILDKLQMIAVEKLFPAMEAALPVISDGLNTVTSAIGPMLDGVMSLFSSGGENSQMQTGLLAIQNTATGLADGFTTNVLPAINNLGSAFQGAWSVVQPIINQLGSLFADKIAQWGPQIQPMLTQVTQIIGGAVNIIAEVIRLVFGGIQTFWQMWGGTILAYLGNAFDMIVGIIGGALDVVQGVIKTVLSLIRGDWQGAFEGIKQITGGVLRIVLAIVNGVLNNIKIIFSGVVGFILNNIWRPFWNGARGVASGVMGSIRGLITAILNGIRGTFGSIVSIIRGLWSAGFNFLRSVASGVMSSTRGIISGILGGIRGAFSSVMGSIRGIWSGGLNAVRNTAGSVMGSVRGAIGRVLDGIKNAFSTAVGAIGRAWDGIRSKAAQPVRFVVNTVFNNGIRSAFNTVAGLFGMSKINPVRLGFSSGGVLPGYTPGRDVHRFLSPTGGVLDLSGGEGILRPEITRMLGARGLAVLNSLRGGAGQVRQKLMELLGHQAFAGGGLVSFRGGRFTERFAAVLQRAFQMSGNLGRLTQGGWRPRTSYSGSSHAGDAVDVVGILPRLVVALRQLGVAAWQRTPSQGNWPWHVHAVPGPSAGRAGGSGISQWRSYLGGGNGLGGSDDGPRVGAKSGLLDKIGEFTEGMMDIFVSADPLGSIRGLFDSALGKSVPGSGWFADMIGKVPRMIVDGIIDKARDVLPGFANGGITPRGPIVVGERGPEVLWPGPGHMITPNGAAVGGASAQEIAGALDEALGRRLSTLGPRELAMLLRDPVMSR